MSGFRRNKPNKNSAHIYCPIYEETFYLQVCLCRHLVAKKAKRRNSPCAGCLVVLARMGEIPRLKIMQVLQSRAPHFADLGFLSKMTGKNQTDLLPILSALVSGGHIEAAMVYARGPNPRKAYRIASSAVECAASGSPEDSCDE